MNFLSTLFGGVKNLLGGAGKAVSGALKTGGNVLGPAVNAGANVGKNLFSSMNAMTPFFGGQSGGPQPYTSTPNMIGAPVGQRMGSTASSAMGPFSMPTSGISNMTSPDSSPLKGNKNWLDSLFPGGKEAGIAGLAIPAIGNMFAPKSPSVPNFGDLSSVQALQNFKPGNSVSPEYQKMIQNNVGQLRDQKVRELQALYHNARPGTDYLTDTNYQRDLALLDQGIQDNLTDELTKAEATFSSQEQDRLSQIAQMDIYSIMAQTGLDAQEANDFKEMFSNVGNMFLTNATRNPNDMSNLMSMFGSK